MSDTITTPPKPETLNPLASETDVYAIQGADPEVLAYAMAKYSRSSISMKESLAEISSQRAEQFLNTFYFQYGHRSIADLAHIPFAVERLSLLAAISLVDEQRWDGQERSTRYQNFRKSGWYTPVTLGDKTSAYTASIAALFAAYDKVGADMLEALKKSIPQPAEMKDDAYVRTLKARAFDVARYLLPLATNTSLGQIVSARTLENQISRLLTSEFSEIRALGDKLKSAAAEPAWNVHHAEARVLCNEVNSVDDACGCRVADILLREVKTAPTLVKYASPINYAIASRTELRAAADEPDAPGRPIEPAPVVDLVEDAGSLEIELATSLLYPECHYSWRQIQRTVAGLSALRISEIIALGTKHRGRHDELPRTFSAGQSFKFDILMGTSADSAVHAPLNRCCVQLIQDYITTSTATTIRSVPANPPSPKPDFMRPITQLWTPPSPPTEPPQIEPTTPTPPTCCRSAHACAQCSRWTSLKPSTSRNCALVLLATSATAASPGRCT